MKVSTFAFMALLTMDLAATTVLLEPPFAFVENGRVILKEDHDVLANERLLAWCVIGSVGGACVSLSVFTPGTNSQTQQQIARIYWVKISTSFISGVCISPEVLHWSGLPANATHVLGISFFTSMLSIAVLQSIFPKTLPLIERVWFSFLEKRLGVSQKEKDVNVENMEQKQDNSR